MIQTVADLIQTGILLGIMGQLFVLYRTYRADHERRKNEATFNFINAVTDRYKGALNHFEEKHGRDQIVAREDFDKEDIATTRSYLSEIERICTGVNFDVFDFDILQRMMGSHLIKKRYQFGEFISHAQDNNEFLYIELTSVVDRLHDHYGEEMVDKMLKRSS